MSKNAFFCKKAVKSPQRRGRLRESAADPALFLLSTDIALSIAYLALNVFHYFEKQQTVD